MLHINELVINFHITDNCNYRCRYCYASWEKRPGSAEVWRDPGKCSRLLESLWGFFNPENRSNPLRQHVRWQFLRLSLAGGEPTLLGPRLAEVVNRARKIGYRVSLITNGSQLGDHTRTGLFADLSMLGLSVDSSMPSANRSIGRVARTGRGLSVDDVAASVEQAKAVNPSLAVKINTVVNAENADEDMSPLIRRVWPHRWKILRMLPVVSDELAVTSDQFAEFVRRHRAFSPIISVEDNSDMTESYIMVDPRGRFFQNTSGCGNGYVYSGPIVEIGPAAAFEQIPFSVAKFSGRYGVIGSQGSAQS